ncbi:leucine-rich repeat protein [Mycoplasma zalophidermidis]|uniref:Leucine-rich repeat protein n=1 Tax=Mycoplasma zalophidermidis TaxID=398174 RepID=A0ABS6DQQ8_9MOLU|nr:leucine-rich repeat protein [Mycoplasma zalophidermidis]MBU4689460.1 leucine-rich repeat protein [Mycoplasma zalophidermidis]MBU4693338.1 leucine-rich repeat protein [Mycoplasma zalophidermidis]MCR8966364.1 leucine-rich repeat protein [Mycoplasma zalophidermidis]
MKKNKLILIGGSISWIPFVSTACSKDKTDDTQNDNEILKTELEIQKEKLQKIIEDAQIKHKSYSSEEGNEAFIKSARGIDEATKVFHEAKTVKELVEAGERLKKIIEETEKYNNLSIDAKRQLVVDKFNKKLLETKITLNKLTKPDAIELLISAINEAQSITNDDLRYYYKLIKTTASLQLAIENAMVLDKKSNKELYELYLSKCSKIINDFEREFGNDEIYLNIQNKIRSLFSNEINADKSNYNEETYGQKENELKVKVGEILRDIKSTTLTKKMVSSLYDNEITSIQLLPEVKYIQQDAFKDYYELENIKFNDKLESIGRGAFSNTKISSLILPKTIRKISGFDRTLITDLVLPEGTEIVEFAFNNANRLTNLTLNEGLIEISGFDETSINSLVLPSTLKKFYGFRHTLITDLTLPEELNTFVTHLPELKTLSIPENFDLDLITTNKSSTVGVVISMDLFPKLENIYVTSVTQKNKLKSILSTNIKIEDENSIRSKINELEAIKNKRIKELQLYVSYLQNIATVAVNNYPNISEKAKSELVSLTQADNNNDNSIMSEIKNFLINYKYSWTKNKKLSDIDKNITSLKQIINLLNYKFSYESVEKDEKLSSETRNNYRNEDLKYNSNKNNFDEIEIKITKLSKLLEKYREIVRNSEYYIEYLSLIAKHMVELKVHTLNVQQKTRLKTILGLQNYESDQVLLKILSDYIFKRKYNSHDTLITTQSKIDELTKLIKIVNFELTTDNISIQSDEELPNVYSIKSDFDLEKNKYEGSKINKWEEIIKIR